MTGPHIEEITEEEAIQLAVEKDLQSAPSVSSVIEDINDGGQGSKYQNGSFQDRFQATNMPNGEIYAESLRNLSENPEMLRFVTLHIYLCFSICLVGYCFLLCLCARRLQIYSFSLPFHITKARLFMFWDYCLMKKFWDRVDVSSNIGTLVFILQMSVQEINITRS